MKVLSLAAFFLVIISTPILTSVAKAQSADSSGDRKVVTKVTPTYPAIARTLALSGSVKLDVVVAANGSAKSI
ncbi:MAG TPA: hypothetical protein VFM77_10760, partial [Terriglobales bacterium]|nr:hypothetical protein [Terriglobales bacterium]